MHFTFDKSEFSFKLRTRKTILLVSRQAHATISFIKFNAEIISQSFTNYHDIYMYFMRTFSEQVCSFAVVFANFMLTLDKTSHYIATK